MADGYEGALARLPAMENGGERIRPEEFDDLVRLHQRRIYRVIYAQLRDGDAAATLTQECFLRAYQGRSGFRGEASVETWLMRIALNLVKDHLRNRRQSFWRRLFGRDNDDAQDTMESLPTVAASPERLLLAREEVNQVMAAVEGLSPQQRMVFTLRFVEEMSLEEIARVMNVETGTVKAHLSRAVGALRNRVRERRRRDD